MNTALAIDSLLRFGGVRALTPAECFDLRKLANASTRVSVIVVEGDAPPKLLGERGHHVTPDGRRVESPNAYRRAWGSSRYVASTLRVEVGAAWLVEWREYSGEKVQP